MSLLEKHIADSLEQLEYLNPSQPIRNFLEISLLQLLEIAKEEVKKLKCVEKNIKTFGEWSAETYEDKMLVNTILDDVLDTLTTTNLTKE